MRRIFVIPVSILAITIFAAIGTVRAQEQFQELWKIGNWDGTLFTTPQGYFDRCSAIVHYQDGTTLAFSLDSRAALQFRVTNRDFRRQPGTTDTVAIDIDGQRFGSYQGTATKPDQVLFDLQRRYNLFAALRRGTRLALSGTLGSWDFSLVDSSAALGRLPDCLPRSPEAYSALPPARRQMMAQTRLNPEYANPANYGAFGCAIEILEGATECGNKQ
jgi:hypothetical protein